MDLEINPLKPGVQFSYMDAFDHGDNTVFTFYDVFFASNRHQNPSMCFDGTYMPISPVSHYFHFLKEYVGSFLYYQQNIDHKVKILWIDSHVVHPDYHDAKKPINYIYDLFVKLGTPMVVLPSINLFNSGYKFEKISVIYDSGTAFVSSEFPHFEQFKHTNNFEVRQFLSHLLQKDKSYPDKVYVSRRGVSNSLNGRNLINHISRPNQKHVDDAIEDFFTSRNYKIIDFSGMSLEKQIKYMFNATHVAGLMGANTWNGIFCDNGTKFYCIKTHMWFHHEYHKDIESVIDSRFKYIELYDLDSYDSVRIELTQKIDSADE